MKYIKSINESLNSTKLTKKQVIAILEKNCQKFLNYTNFDDGCLIFRKDEDRGDYALVNPKLSTSERIAPYGPNFHNLLISNLDSWRGWPRRNKSLIFASERRALTHAAGFVKSGRAVDYVVIPFDSTKVATGDRSDFWECFGKIPKRAAFCEDGASRPSVAYYVASLMTDLNTIKDVFDPTPFKPEWSKKMIPGRWVRKYEPEKVNTDWQQLKSVLESAELNETMINKYFKVRGRLFWNPSKNLLENLNDLLNPTFNNFKLGDVTSTMDLYSQLDPDSENQSRGSLESWCEDEVILIKCGLIDSILDEFEIEY